MTAQTIVDESVEIIDSILNCLAAEQGTTSLSYLRHSVFVDGYRLPSGTVEAIEFLQHLGFEVEGRKAGSQVRWHVSI